MPADMKSSTRQTAWRLLRWIAIDATLGATCGGLYGLIFGGFGALVHGEPLRLISIAVDFAGWGIADGVLVGAYGALFNSDGEVAGSSRSLPNVADKQKSPIEAARHPMVPSPHQPQNSLTAAIGTDRRRTLTVGT